MNKHQQCIPLLLYVHMSVCHSGYTKAEKKGTTAARSSIIVKPGCLRCLEASVKPGEKELKVILLSSALESLLVAAGGRNYARRWCFDNIPVNAVLYMQQLAPLCQVTTRREQGSL